eukprot:g3971.t1
MDLPDISDSHATLTRPDLSVKKLDCGTANGRLPHGHPSVNGCACDFDALRSTIFFFGGGTPHAEVYHATSALRLEGWDGANPTAQWQVVSSPGSIESDEIPLARQGVKGRLGVSQGGDSFSSPPTLPWRRLDCDGQAPSPRVWHSACQAVHGQWFIYGGSTWQFEEPAEPHDFRSLFVLHIAERRWSSLAAASPTRPPWAVAACLLPLGCCQLLLLGGTLPHKLGATGLNAHSLRHWRSWYNRLDEPWVFDLRSGEWTPRGAAVALPSDAEDREQHVAEVYLRSHFAAVFVPSRRSALVLGGSRYFTGEYFNDLLELQLPSSTSSRARRGQDLESGEPASFVWPIPGAERTASPSPSGRRPRSLADTGLRGASAGDAAGGHHQPGRWEDQRGGEAKSRVARDEDEDEDDESHIESHRVTGG